jgi:hypothetical protein
MNRIISLALAAALALLPLACGEEEPPPPPVNTPVGVLIYIEVSFNQNDIDLLKKSLSPNFVLYFDPREMGRPRPEGTPYRLPSSYSFTEFWHIAYNMFNSAYSINLSISTGGVGEPGPEETTFRAGDVELSLLVAVDEKSGYLAEGPCHFEFEKYKNKQGRDRWRLTNWWDNTEGGADEPPGFEHVPLWYILSMYEKPT